MLGFIVRRTAQSVLTLFLFITFVYFLMQLLPGDFTNMLILNPNVDPETRARLQEQLGLNRPLYEQYYRYMLNFVQGDLGVSFNQQGRPVVEIIAERFPRTLVLFMTATIVAFYVGFILGKFISWNKRTTVETSATIIGVYLFTIFTPWFALMLLWLFSFQLDWFPLAKFITPQIWIGSDVSANSIFLWLIVTAAAVLSIALTLTLIISKLRIRYGRPLVLLASLVVAALAVIVWSRSGNGMFAWDIVSHMALPVIMLTLISMAGTMLLTRSSMLEVLRDDYVLVARTKGLPESRIRDKYVARNAILPVLTSFVLSIAAAIDGGVITESIFAWEGIGFTLLDAASSGDVPLAVAAFLFVGIFALVAHIIADILYVMLDPRLRVKSDS